MSARIWGRSAASTSPARSAYIARSVLLRLARGRDMTGWDGAIETSTHPDRGPAIRTVASSHASTAEELAGLIRGHWGIESMHWVLDVAFWEDGSRVLGGHAGANLAMLRKAALALLKR